jgi:hypothetical protein
MSSDIVVRKSLCKKGENFWDFRTRESPIRQPSWRDMGKRGKDCLEDSVEMEKQLTGNAEQISAVLVGKEIVKLVEAAPRDARQTQAAGLVGGEEDAVFGVGASVAGWGEEGLNAVDLAVEERGEALVVGLDRVGFEGGFGQDGGAEELRAGGDARAGERDDVGFGEGEEGGDEDFGGVGGHSGMVIRRRF